MTKADILVYLKEHQDSRGIAHWTKREEQRSGLKSYGIGLTKLRRLAKQIGRDAKLARQLWKAKIYEMRILSLLIDGPKTLTMAQAEAQVDDLAGGYLAHVFSSCDATLAKTPFVVELADRWVKSRDVVRKSCGYGLLYEISKDKKKTAPDESYFLAHVDRIDTHHAKQSTSTLMSMAGALMGIGKRTKTLNEAALRVAKAIGPIDFDPDGRCDPFDVVKQLTGPHTREKLGL
jgi:3-methyladenine DNA glycosylase AlkD